MIDGIKVLEEIHVTGDPSSIVAGLFCFLIFLLLVYVFCKEVNKKIERIKRSDDEGWNNILKKEVIVYTALLIFALASGVGIFTSCTIRHFTTDYMKYRVFIEDSCSYNTFTSKYEVINTFDDGSVMIREKE